MLYNFVLCIFLLCNVSVSWAGAWGTGSFENDSALDWVSENITSATSMNVLAHMFAFVQANKYLDVDDCSSAIAAAEIVAAMKMNKFDKLPKDVATWAKRNKGHFNKALALEALKSVNICSDSKKSELAVLWRGAQYDEWKRTIDNIKARLK